MIAGKRWLGRFRQASSAGSTLVDETAIVNYG
jgi:hypothetical protein